MRKLEKDAVHLTADEYQRYKDAINAAVDDKAATQSMIDSANESAQAWKQAANTIENDLISAFENGVKTGASLFTDLKNLAIKLFSQLILRPMLQPLSNSMASMFGGGGGAGGSMNLLGEGFSLANNTWGGAAGGMGPPNPNAMFGTSGMSETYGGYAAGAMGGAAAGYGIGTVAGQLFGNSRNQQSMQMGATIGGAVGSIWGPIGSLVGSMIGSAVGSLIKDGGGAKVGGSATTGGTWSTQLMEGGRYFTPNDADADLKKAVKVSSDSYSGLYKLLGGGGLTSAQFAMGYDTDPKGTAPNRARAGVIVNGRQVYQSNQEDLGTDPARLTAALALEAQRSILAALQASDLPADIAALLNSVNAATASQDTISGLEQFASAMQNIDTLMSSNLGDEATKYLKAQNATAMDSFHGTATALRDLLTAADYSTAGVDALTAATNDYYRSAVILLAQIEQVKQSISNMFGDTIRSMTLQTLDKPGQYDYLMNEAGDLQAQMLASNDPAQIAALAQKINDDLNAAFGLLTPEQQQEYLGQFTQNITDLNTTVEDKLNEIRDNVTTAVGDTLTEASNNLSLAADKFTTAANTADNAANTNLAAANTPLQVDVTTHDGAPAEVNVSGG
jgi:hypothetical protein